MKYEIILFSAMEKLLDTSTKKGNAIIRSLMNYPISKPYAMKDSNLYNKMSSEITHEMFGILLVLPYFEILKESTTKDKKFYE